VSVAHDRDPCKTDEPVEMAFGGPRNHVLDGVHIGATWQIRSNDPSSATMRLYVRLLWPLV